MRHNVHSIAATQQAIMRGCKLARCNLATKAHGNHNFKTWPLSIRILSELVQPSVLSISNLTPTLAFTWKYAMPSLLTFISYHQPTPTLHRHHSPPRCTALPPKRIGAVAKDLQQALQSCLQSRVSRISVKLPVGAKLGTEIRSNDEDLIERQKAGDREVARILAGMFERTGLKVCIVFETARDRSMASKMWGKNTEFEIGDIMERRGRKKGKSVGSGAEGFGKGGVSRRVQNEVDVYIILGGSPSFMNSVRNLAKEKGMDKLIILANVNEDARRFPVDLLHFLQDEFIGAYHYEPNPHPQWKGGVLFRKFPDGQFITLLFLAEGMTCFVCTC